MPTTVSESLFPFNAVFSLSLYYRLCSHSVLLVGPCWKIWKPTSGISNTCAGPLVLCQIPQTAIAPGGMHTNVANVQGWAQCAMMFGHGWSWPVMVAVGAWLGTEWWLGMTHSNSCAPSGWAGCVCSFNRSSPGMRLQMSVHPCFLQVGYRERKWQLPAPSFSKKSPNRVWNQYELICLPFDAGMCKLSLVCCLIT